MYVTSAPATGLPSACSTRPLTTAPGSSSRETRGSSWRAPPRPRSSCMPWIARRAGTSGPSGCSNATKTRRPESCRLAASTELSAIS